MIEVGRSAIIVIDMQYDFVGENAVIPCKCTPGLIENISRLLDFARDNGVPVIYTQEAHRPTHIDFGRELDGDEPVHCIEGTEGHRIIDELAPHEKDYVIMKRRYSAFFQTDLLVLLHSLKIDTLIIVGAATDVCVRATATDAQQYGYFVQVPKDCVAGSTPFQHEAALDHIRYILGKVVSLDELIN